MYFPMFNKNHFEFKKKQNEIVLRFKQEGINVRIDKRKPTNGRYSGIIGCKKKTLVITIPLSILH